MEIIAETDISLRPVVNCDLRSLPETEPVPDHATYVAERERRLAFDARCNENYDKYLKSHDQAMKIAKLLKYGRELA